MSVRIVFDNHRPLYTNLDIIKGRAILSITKNETIAAITVKLEGDCKTRLTAEIDDPYHQRWRERRERRAGGPDVAVETELHKVWPLLIITLSRTLRSRSLLCLYVSAAIFHKQAIEIYDLCKLSRLMDCVHTCQLECS